MKTLKSNLWPALLGALVGLSTIAAAMIAIIMMLVTVARAATYNTFFNNIEQGPGSTASPMLQVSDGLVKKTPEAGGPTEVAPVAQPKVEISQTAAAPVVAVVPEERRFRLGLLGHVIARDAHELDDKDVGGGTLSATYFVGRDFGLTAFGGLGSHKAFGGAEVEFVPIRLTLFGLDHFIEAGAAIGLSTLGHEAGLKGTGHGGAKLTVNFGPQIGITAGVRTNFTDRSRYNYVMADAGLAVRL